jgi:hypothetical protein
VVIYNEGQEGSTETFPGSVEQPEFTLSAVFAHYAIGRELDELKQHREVRARIRTAASIESCTTLNIPAPLEPETRRGR